MHIVDMQQSKLTGKACTEECCLFVSMQNIIFAGSQGVRGGKIKWHVESELGQRRSDANVPDERDPGRSRDSKSGELDVISERIGDEIDRMPGLHERSNSVENAERCAARPSAGDYDRESERG